MRRSSTLLVKVLNTYSGSDIMANMKSNNKPRPTTWLVKVIGRYFDKRATTRWIKRAKLDTVEHKVQCGVTRLMAKHNTVRSEVKRWVLTGTGRSEAVAQAGTHGSIKAVSQCKLTSRQIYKLPRIKIVVILKNDKFDIDLGSLETRECAIDNLSMAMGHVLLWPSQLWFGFHFGVVHPTPSSSFSLEDRTNFYGFTSLKILLYANW